MIVSNQTKRVRHDLRLLYAEDDKHTAEMMKKILERRFTDVVYASDGREAFELFLQGGVELMIVDVNMPHCNGLELCTKVREINEDIPIMMATAFNETDCLVEALQIGVDRFLFKPINTAKLDKNLKALVKKAFLLRQDFGGIVV